MGRPGRLSLILGAGQAVGRGGLALGLLILVRELSPRDFGNLALGLAIVQVLSSLADAGFSRLLVRDVARGADERTRIVHELLTARLLAVVLVLIATAVGLFALNGPFTGPVKLLLLSYLLTESVALGFENAAVGVERPWRFVVAQSAGTGALLSGLGVLALKDRTTLTWAMSILAISSAVKVVSHLAAWQLPLRLVAHRRATPVRRLYANALPFLGLAVLATVYYRTGVVALHWTRGAVQTAPYAAALRVVDLVGVLAGVVFSGLSPALSRMHRDRPDQLHAAWRQTLWKVGRWAIPATILLELFAPALAGAVFGHRYGFAAGRALRIMAPGMLLMVLQSVSAAVIFMADHHRRILALTSVNVAVAVAGSFVLSALWGGSGAATALSSAEVVSFTTFAWLVNRRYRAVGR